MQVFGPNELLSDVHEKDLCIGCGACTELCPYFKNFKGRTSMLFSCTREQGRCHAYCPKTEIDLDELSNFMFGQSYKGSPVGAYKKMVASKAGPNMAPGNFQSGGTVSALVAYALQNGLIDAAVLTTQKGLMPEPHLVTNPEDVVKFASSKYMAAPTVAMLHKGLERGYQKMGFVGTPCQMTAVAKIRTNPLKSDDFQDPVGLAIGLFCTWALDARDLFKFISGRVDIDKIRKMDIPPPPAEILTIETDDKKMEIPLSDIRPLRPGSCAICPDMTAEFSDISVGVLEERPEVNTLIIRTDKGADLVASAEKDGYLVLEEMPEEKFEHLFQAAGNKKKLAFEQVAERGLLNTGGDDGRAAVRVNASTLEKINI